MFKKIFITAMSAFTLLSCGKKIGDNQEVKSQETFDAYLLVGTYTQKDSKGINVYKFNSETGTSIHISEAEVSNPSYLAISKDEKYVYAISENGVNDSKVSAFGLDKANGRLEFINNRPSGNGPCFISVDKSGKYIVTADYGGGTVSMFTTNKDGSIAEPSSVYTFEGKSINSERQTKSYLHNVKFSPDERFVFANDLGADKIYKFVVDTAQQPLYLRYNNANDLSVKAGSGPRHTEFHPNGKYAYTITEISGDVIVFDYDTEEGLLKEKQTIKADTLNAAGSGDIQITPNGEYLYVSNRLKGDGIAIFAINQETGELTKIGYQETGIHPRNFVISPNGKLLLSANRDSNTIQVFKIENSGLLTDLNKNIDLSMPVCLKFASLQ